MSRVWLSIIICCLCIGFFNHTMEANNAVLLEVAQETFDIVLPFMLVTCFWNGILYVAKDSGLLKTLENILHPLLKCILPDIKEDEETLGYVAGNIIANMFGLGSAATPMGLKAIEGMQKHNDKKHIATRSMVTFLVLNTGGVTILPTSIIALRNAYNSNNPNNFVIFAIISTLFSCFIGLLVDRMVNYRDR